MKVVSLIPYAGYYLQ